jgi:hypothetical protein
MRGKIKKNQIKWHIYILARRRERKKKFTTTQPSYIHTTPMKKYRWWASNITPESIVWTWESRQLLIHCILTHSYAANRNFLKKLIFLLINRPNYHLFTCLLQKKNSHYTTYLKDKKTAIIFKLNTMITNRSKTIYLL